ncbi:hypothetical protein DYH09_07355 [bacterium CPR1]|nr:hypothetical protein [bacterium CPR1]
MEEIMANTITLPRPPLSAPSTPRVALASAQIGERLATPDPRASQARAAAELVHSGPQAGDNPQGEAMWASMKLAMARQNAQDEARFNGPGETRKPNGDVSTVEQGSLLRHTVQSPDGSSRVAEVGPQSTRLTETAPDGTSTVTFADDRGFLTVEHRDASGDTLSTDVYIYGPDGLEYQHVDGPWDPPAENRNIGPPGMGQTR